MFRDFKNNLNIQLTSLINAQMGRMREKKRVEMMPEFFTLAN